MEDNIIYHSLILYIGGGVFANASIATVYVKLEDEKYGSLRSENMGPSVPFSLYMGPLGTIFLTQYEPYGTHIGDDMGPLGTI